MKTRLVIILGAILLLLTVMPCFPAKTTIPEWSKYFPSDTILVIGIRDFSSAFKSLLEPPPKDYKGISLYTIINKTDLDFKEKTNKVFKDISTFIDNFSGDVAVGFVGETFKDMRPIFIAPVKQEGLDPVKSFEINILPCLQDLLGPIGMTFDGDFFILEMIPEIYIKISDGVVYASTDKETLSRALKNIVEEEDSLFTDPLFKSFCSSVRSTGFIIYCNVNKINERTLPKKGSYKRDMYESLGFNCLEFAGFSMGTSDTHFMSDFILYFSDTYESLARFLFQPEIRPSALSYVPEDFQAFFAVSVDDAIGTWFTWQQIVRRIVDDIGWDEYRQLLSNWDIKHGLSFENEIIGNLGREISVAFRVTDDSIKPEYILFVSVKKRDKANKTIENVLQEHGLALIKHKNSDGKIPMHSFSINGKQYTYTFVGNLLIFAEGQDLVEKALTAQKNKMSLVNTKTFRAIRANIPETFTSLLYVDESALDSFLLRLAEKIPQMPEKDSTTGDDIDAENVEKPTFALVAYSVGDIIKRTGEMLEKKSRDLNATTLTMQVQNGTFAFRTSVSIPQINLILEFVIKEAVPFIIQAQENKKDATRIYNIRQLALGVMQYYIDHKESPGRASELFPAYVSSIETFQSPFRKKPINPGNLDAECDYEFVKGVKETEPSDTIILYEKKPFKGDNVYVGLNDGSEQMITAEERDKLLEGQKSLREQ